MFTRAKENSTELLEIVYFVRILNSTKVVIFSIRKKAPRLI